MDTRGEMTIARLSMKKRKQESPRLIKITTRSVLLFPDINTEMKSESATCTAAHLHDRHHARSDLMIGGKRAIFSTLSSPRPTLELRRQTPRCAGVPWERGWYVHSRFFESEGSDMFLATAQRGHHCCRSACCKRSVQDMIVCAISAGDGSVPLGGTAAAAPGLLRWAPFTVEGQLLGSSQDTRHILAVS